MAIAEFERRGLSDDEVQIDRFVGDMPDEDLPSLATRSRSSALIGGGIAAVLGALLGGLLGGLMFAGKLGVSPLAFAGLAGLAAGLLGALVSGIAGAAIPRRKLEALRSRINAGNALVTIHVPSKRRAAALVANLRRLGAVRVGTL